MAIRHIINGSQKVWLARVAYQGRRRAKVCVPHEGRGAGWFCRRSFKSERGGSEMAALILAVIVLSVTTPALAQRATVLKGNGEKAIPVWRSEAAAKDGTSLAEAGQPDLAVKYIACAVPPGTKILLMPTGGYSTVRITVLEGQSRGCEGNVYSWDVNGDKKQRQAAAAGEAKKWKAEQECTAIAQKVYDATLGGNSRNVIEAIDAQTHAKVDCMTKAGYTDTWDHKRLKMDEWAKDNSGCGLRSGTIFEKYDECRRKGAETTK
jgi:hypothetical protein